MYDLKSFIYLAKSAETEMEEVLLGVKPAALGFWDTVYGDLFVCKLQRVPGRYYEWAIGHTMEKLLALIYAYYYPVSPEGDRLLGNALGYEESAITSYVSSCKYKKASVPAWKKKWWKIKSTAEKLGWKTIFAAIYILLFKRGANRSLILRVIKKEGLNA